MNTARQRRTQTIIILVTLALCAMFLALGTTRLLGQALLPTEAPSAGPVRPSSGLSSAMFGRKNARAILVRNIFDSSRGDLTQEPVDETAIGQADDWDPSQPPPACSGSNRLVGSIVSPRDRAWSFAAITGSENTAMLYREGMEVDGKRVLTIFPESVILQPGGGSRCTLAMFDAQAPRPKRTASVKEDDGEPPRRSRSRDRNAGLSDEELDQGIQKISDTKVIVQRSLVEKLLGDQASLMRTARVIPHQENGQTVGVKLYGIRRNSLLGRLGLKNGDMLRTINGFNLSDPAAALEAFATLRSSDNLSVALKDRTLDIGIQ